MPRAGRWPGPTSCGAAPSGRKPSLPERARRPAGSAEDQRRVGAAEAERVRERHLGRLGGPCSSTWSSSHSGSGSSRLMVGGRLLVSSARTQRSASSAPAAPSRWPVIDLVARRKDASVMASPKTERTAADSAGIAEPACSSRGRSRSPTSSGATPAHRPAPAACSAAPSPVLRRAGAMWLASAEASVPQHLGADARAARARRAPATRARRTAAPLADHEAVAIAVEGAARPLGLVVAHRRGPSWPRSRRPHRGRRSPPREPPAEHDVGVAALDHAPPRRSRVGAGGAGADVTEVRAAQAVT